MGEEQEEDVSGLLLNLTEGYKDSVIPLLSDFFPLAKNTVIEEKASGSRKSSRDKSPQCKERDRRGKMSDLFSVLQSMVPNLPPKATKTEIIEETVVRITRLEKELNWLEKLKEEQAKTSKREFLASDERNSVVDVTVSSNLAFFGVHLMVRERLATEILTVFEKYGAEVLAANVAVNDRSLRLTVTATVYGNGEEIFRRIKEEISDL